jgi:hypothetical protein
MHFPSLNPKNPRYPMRTLLAYKCSFCIRARPYASRSACAAHETRCFDNPTTRSCATCEHLVHSYVPAAREGCVKDAWSCAASDLLNPLTTECHDWEQEVEDEF